MPTQQRWSMKLDCLRRFVDATAILLLALGVATGVSGCSMTLGSGTAGNGGAGETTILGSGTPTTQTRQVSDFHEVDFSGVGELDIQETGSESLSILADSNVLPLLTSTASNGRLTLATQPGVTFQTDSPIRYTLTVKTLDTLVASGAGTTMGTSIEAASLHVSVSGVGSVTLQGHAATLTLSLSGAGSFDGSALASQTATVTVGGTGDAVVQVSDTLDATVSGVGSIEYIGNPKVTAHVSGVGTIHKRG